MSEINLVYFIIIVFFMGNKIIFIWFSEMVIRFRMEVVVEMVFV